MTARESNIVRFHRVQREEAELIVGPALDLAERLRREGCTWSACVEELNRQGFTSRTGVAWTYPSLVQAVAKRRKRQA